MKLTKPQQANSNRTVKYFDHATVSLSKNAKEFTLWLSFDDGKTSYQQQLILNMDELNSVVALALSSNK
jgi:hypothetical protein